MANNTAYQMIVSRMPVIAGAALAQYDAVELNTAGKAVKAAGAGQFVGIIEYGADAADNMATAVKGAFPGVAAEVITAGAKVTVGTGETAGKFVVADTAGNVVYGTALTAADAIGDTFTVLMNDVAMVIPII